VDVGSFAVAVQSKIKNQKIETPSPGTQRSLAMSDLPAVAPRPPAVPPKPGKVQAIAIMCLVDGILNILYGGGLTVGFLAGMVTACCTPLGLYPIVLGILEIIEATKLLADPIRTDRPARWLAVMQIVNIISGDVISLVVGILSLVFYNEPEVVAYYAAAGRGPDQPAAPPPSAPDENA
jgi:hypothetical protein